MRRRTVPVDIAALLLALLLLFLAFLFHPLGSADQFSPEPCRFLSEGCEVAASAVASSALWRQSPPWSRGGVTRNVPWARMAA